jgi:hypothetical protein
VSITVCIGARTLFYPSGGGHLWAYMNWALGFKALGCHVLWLEEVPRSESYERVQQHVALLRQRLGRVGLNDDIVLAPSRGTSLPGELPHGCRPVEAAYGVDLFLNQLYEMEEELVRCFRRSALLDIDPGLLQIWMRKNVVRVAPHDLYFTIGETVGQAASAVPDVGVSWVYTPPCVSLEAWSAAAAAPDEPLTTVTHWHSAEWVVDGENMYRNDKRSAFLEFVEVPTRVSTAIELAVCLGKDEDADRALLHRHGWRVTDSADVVASPEGFQRYVQKSKGEFSCAKPSCTRLQNAWISDRTLCYLASGKPAVVQHTGASRYLPDQDGILRFRTVEEAVRCIETVSQDYDRHQRHARALAEEYFDARKVAGRVLERALS